MCMLSYAWMRERFRKKRKRKEKERKIIGQENQMLELTFDPFRALSTSAFLKWIHHVHRKQKQKKKKYKNEEK